MSLPNPSELDYWRVGEPLPGLPGPNTTAELDYWRLGEVYPELLGGTVATTGVLTRMLMGVGL